MPAKYICDHQLCVTFTENSKLHFFNYTVLKPPLHLNIEKVTVVVLSENQVKGLNYYRNLCKLL